MKNYLVIGLGVSGISASSFLLKNNFNVFVYDDNKNKAKELKNSNILHNNCEIITKLNEKSLFHIDCIILSPGVVLKEKIKKLIKEFDIDVVGELAFASKYCEAPIYAITGTNGKTTTANLLDTIFKTAKENSHLVGNVGNAFSGEVDKIAQNDKVVCEVSSFQLEYSQGFAPYAVGFLNIAPDHLDRYKDFEEYFNAKKLILERVGDGKVFLNYDDEKLRKLGENCNCEFFSTSLLPNKIDGIYHENNKIYQKKGEKTQYIVDLSKNKLLGEHNLSNILCAVSLALYAGITPEIIQKSIKNFKAPRHRMEYAGKINGVLFYNDSKSTNIHSALSAVKCFDDNKILLMLGGSGKGEDFNQLFVNLPNNIKYLITFGKMGKKLAKIAKNNGKTNIFQCKDVFDAVVCARKLAEQNDIVLFSPACASYDEFNNYRERGEYFCNLVMEHNEN